MACDYYDVEAFRASNPTRVPREIALECTEKSVPQETIFIWGDSHAQQFSYGLRKILGSEFAIRQIASSGCAPTIVTMSSKFDFCKKSNFEAFRYISKIKPSVVLLAQRMGHDVENYKHLISALKSIGVDKIILMGPSPQWSIDLHKILITDIDNIPKKLSRLRDSQVIETNEQLRIHFSSVPKVKFVNIIDLFCDEEGCLVYLGDDIEQGITTHDYGHLTPIASEYVAEKLKASLVKIKNSKQN